MTTDRNSIATAWFDVIAAQGQNHSIGVLELTPNHITLARKEFEAHTKKGINIQDVFTGNLRCIGESTPCDFTITRVELDRVEGQFCANAPDLSRLLQRYDEACEWGRSLVELKPENLREALRNKGSRVLFGSGPTTIRWDQKGEQLDYFEITIRPLSYQILTFTNSQLAGGKYSSHLLTQNYCEPSDIGLVNSEFLEKVIVVLKHCPDKQLFDTFLPVIHATAAELHRRRNR